jgi:phosphoribosylformylglycinamidine cyclo-ligase
MFDASALKTMAAPVLVASTDGVGTKTKVAAAMGRWDSIGQDLVNHCVNDILAQGAQPLFFMDYIAASKLDAGQAATVVAGMAVACRDNGLALLGGETAEMPGVYVDGEMDVAGTIVGVVDRSRAIDGSRIAAGDAILGLPSNGLHTNGYSLARRALAGLDWRVQRTDIGACIGDALLAVHRSYLSQFRKLDAAGVGIHGIAHITGGGLLENVPRILPNDLAAVFRVGAWPVPPIFGLIRQRLGDVGRDELYRAFNMGIGLCVVVPQADAARALAALGEGAIVGEISHRAGPAVALER